MKELSLLPYYLDICIYSLESVELSFNLFLNTFKGCIVLIVTSRIFDDYNINLIYLLRRLAKVYLKRLLPLLQVKLICDHVISKFKYSDNETIFFMGRDGYATGHTQFQFLETIHLSFLLRFCSSFIRPYSRYQVLYNFGSNSWFIF